MVLAFNENVAAQIFARSKQRSLGRVTTVGSKENLDWLADGHLNYQSLVVSSGCDETARGVKNLLARVRSQLEPHARNRSAKPGSISLENVAQALMHN